MSTSVVSLDDRLGGIHKRFLELLASGKYQDALVWLNDLKLKASLEGDTEGYYFASYLMGICLQQEGNLPAATKVLRQTIKGSPDPFVRLSGRVHLAKVYSQSGRFSKAATSLRDALAAIGSRKEGIDPKLRDQLRLPILWRLGLAEKLAGGETGGERHLDEHWDLSAISPYQRANALAVRAIVFASGDRKRRFSEVEESVKEAGLVYSGSSADLLNSFAFRDKAELGMRLLEAVLDLHSGRKVSGYAKLHLVRYAAQARGVRPSSEGFAEMIYPSLSISPILPELLTVPEAEYERWASSQSDWEAIREGRLMAREIIERMPPVVVEPISSGGESSPVSLDLHGEATMVSRYDAFISYRHTEADRAFARKLVKELELDSYRLAIDERDFRPNEMFLDEMERCIKESRFTLAIVSPRYFESGNTQEEAIICKVLDMSERRRRLIPVILEKVVGMPIWLYGIVGIDFTDKSPMIPPLEKLKRVLGSPGGRP